MLELTIMGIALQGDGPSPSLLLHPYGTDKVIFLPLEPADAFPLSSSLHGPVGGRETPRRDLTARILRHLGGRLLAVEIFGFDTGAVQAAAVIQAGPTTVRLLCRPAEGVQLSLQCGAPLRAEAEALNSAKSLDDPSLDLSPHVRTLVRTAMLRDKLGDALVDDGSFDFSRIPLVLESTINREAPRVVGQKKGPTVNISVDNQVVEFSVAVSPVLSTEAGTDSASRPEEDRWAALLRVLSPETKTLM